MPYILDGHPIAVGVPFTHNETNFPANWIQCASEEEKAAIGLVWQADPQPWDQRWQWGWTEDGQPIWKDHAQLVEQWTQQTRATANSLLTPTDWIIIREADNGKAADPVLKTWREEIRLAAGSKVYEIEHTADTPALVAYLTGPDYPAWPADPYGPQPVTPQEDAPMPVAAEEDAPLAEAA